MTAGITDGVHESGRESGERFLVVRLTALGDILHTLPAVAALRAAHPEARIDWVVEPKWMPVVEASPAVSEVLPFDRGSFLAARTSLARLRSANYSCAIDFQGLYKSSVLALLSGAPRRIGLDRAWAREPGAALFYTRRIRPEGRHVAELNYSLAEAAGAVRPARPCYPLRVPSRAAASVSEQLRRAGVGEYVVIGPGASWRAKCWPAERFGQLCRELEVRQGLRCIVIRGPGEEVLAESVRRAAAPSDPLVLSTTVEELMALLAASRCVVAGDSGPLHLAAALGVPVVGLYGPTDPARNGPFAPGAIVVSAARPEEISYKRTMSASPAILRITVEQVLEAASPCLKKTA